MLPADAGVAGGLPPRHAPCRDAPPPRVAPRQVNTASRMESGSERNRVNVSERAARLLQAKAPHVRLAPRGVLQVKGKGLMECFFLEDSDEALAAALDLTPGLPSPSEGDEDGPEPPNGQWVILDRSAGSSELAPGATPRVGSVSVRAGSIFGYGDRGSVASALGGSRGGSVAHPGFTPRKGSTALPQRKGSISGLGQLLLGGGAGRGGAVASSASGWPRPERHRSDEQPPSAGGLGGQGSSAVRLLGSLGSLLHLPLALKGGPLAAAGDRGSRDQERSYRGVSRGSRHNSLDLVRPLALEVRVEAAQPPQLPEADEAQVWLPVLPSAAAAWATGTLPLAPGSGPRPKRHTISHQPVILEMEGVSVSGGAESDVAPLRPASPRAKTRASSTGTATSKRTTAEEEGNDEVIWAREATGEKSSTRV